MPDDISGADADPVSEGPRYHAIARTLSNGIRAGRYPIGSMLPTEREIRAEFGVSRHTAREALRMLVERGLVRRRQGSGSVVTGDARPARFEHVLDSLDRLVDYTAGARLEPIVRRPLAEDDALAETLGLGGSGWLRIDGLRRTGPDTPPICWTAIFLPDRFEDVAGEIGCQPVPVYGLIEARHPVSIAEVEQTVDAVALTPEIAGLLEAERGEPAIETVRRYRDTSGETVLIAVSIHPAGRTRFVSTMRRRLPESRLPPTSLPRAG